MYRSVTNRIYEYMNFLELLCGLHNMNYLRYSCLKLLCTFYFLNEQNYNNLCTSSLITIATPVCSTYKPDALMHNLSVTE